jgi:hypothetical protein
MANSLIYICLRIWYCDGWHLRYMNQHPSLRAMKSADCEPFVNTALVRHQKFPHVHTIGSSQKGFDTGPKPLDLMCGLVSNILPPSGDILNAKLHNDSRFLARAVDASQKRGYRRRDMKPPSCLCKMPNLWKCHDNASPHTLKKNNSSLCYAPVC